MKRFEKGIIGLAILLFLLLQAQRIGLPWILEFEAGFQEMSAMHHLQTGIWENRFLSVLAEVDGEKFYHTAHPPLLHIIYALLYKLFGVKEWVTRGFSLLLLVGSIWIWSRFLRGNQKLIFWLVALFLPINFRLAMSTNYEFLTIFSISFFLYSFEKWRSNSRGFFFGLLLFASLLMFFSDWPGYLVIPSLGLIFLRSQKERKRLFELFIFELMVLVLLIFYQARMSEEFVVLMHSGTRSNPLYLLKSKTYLELFEHLKWMLGLPGLILILAGLIKCFAGEKSNDAWRVFRFSGYFLILLWLSASQLVSRHYVYLLYFSFFFALILALALSQMAHWRFALALVLLFFLPQNYLGFKIRDARAYYFAQELSQQSNIQTCFSSSALGTLYFYDKIETVVPVSEKSALAGNKMDFDLYLIDRVSQEVKEFNPVLHGFNYQLCWLFSDLMVYIKKQAGFSCDYLAPKILKHAKTDNWWEPSVEVLWLENRAWYGLKQAPGLARISVLKFPVEETGLSFKPALYLPPLSKKGDGVNFMILGSGEKGTRLAYARFMKSGSGGLTQIKLEGIKEFFLITDAGPKADYSFDDAYWLEAKFYSEEEAGEEK